VSVNSYMKLEELHSSLTVSVAGTSPKRTKIQGGIWKADVVTLAKICCNYFRTLFHSKLNMCIWFHVYYWQLLGHSGLLPGH